MLEKLKSIFRLEELKNKIFFTLMLLVVCRIGAYIPVPGINADEAVKLFRSVVGGTQNLFQLVDIFSGGAFSQMTVTALGVMPYITASIVMQMLMMMIPNFQREIKENPEQGKRKVGKWTRVLTVLLALFQSSIYARYVLHLNASNPGVILSDIASITLFGFPVVFFGLFMLTMTAGTMFLMWIGDQISERGVGNGTSLIITLGIVASLPRTLSTIFRQLNLESQESGQLTFTSLLVLGALFVMIVMGTLYVIQGQRKVPLQYARRGMDKNDGMSGAQQAAYIPLKINYAGVIPVIFASTVLMFPATLGQFFPDVSWIASISKYLTPGNMVYLLLYVSLIIFFTYFWTSTQFHPEQIASDLKRNGAFIPGVRQGKPTEDFLETTMNKITFVGALFLALIAVLPTLVGKLLHVDSTITYFFGGTSLLILVGVVLDTLKQIDSHLLMERYDGFMTKKKMRVRI
jgi:preprotein translocase subunit SecY